MTETKREVFDELLEIAGNAMDQAMSAQYPSDENGCAPSGIGKAIRDILDPIEKHYDAALTDDLPVIPKAQSDWIKQCKTNDDSLSFALGDETTPIEVAKTFRVWGGYTDKNKDKWLKLQNDFARAWLLGVWCVEGTGEIVELEEEK